MARQVALILLYVSIVLELSSALAKQGASVKQGVDGNIRVFYEHPAPKLTIGEWVSNGPSNLDQKLTFFFALKQRNLDQLEAKFWSISDPNSKAYGRYMTPEEVTDLISVPGAADAVLSWLKDFAVENLHVVRSKDFIRATMPVSLAQELLQTQFEEFKHKADDVKLNRAPIYSLPKEVAGHVDFVEGVTGFHRLRRLDVHVVPLEKHPLQKVVTPKVITDYYNVGPNKVTNEKATQSVFEALGQYYSPTDLTSFFNRFGIPNQKIAKLIGPNKGYDPGAEANLDIQYIMSVAVDVPTWFWSIENSETGDPFLEYITAVLDHDDPPLVHSLSYGGLEFAIPESYMRRVNTEFQKAGVRGLTIVFASGDDGVASYIARDDPTRCEPFQPDYPAGSPFVTVVGATEFASEGGEIACSSQTGSSITTGGGFSTKIDRPAYQDKAVLAYLNATDSNLPPLSLWNKKGRGYPDVSLNGHLYAIYLGGSLVGVDGTSASTPAVAAMVSLINDARLNAGLPPVGFINPLLYDIWERHPEVYWDVTQGDNKCCANTGYHKITCCKHGFAATEGWDPVTGLGSFDFQLLKKFAVEAATQSRPDAPQVPLLTAMDL